MPALVYASALRVADDAFTLAVDIAHTIVTGGDSDDDSAPRRIKGRPPEVDIFHRSDVVLCLAGFSNGKAIPSAEMKQSMPSKHMHSFLRANASALGLNAVSNIYIDEDQCKLNLTPSRSYDLDACHPRLYLVSITLTYSFRARESQGKDFNLFTRRSYLPFITALNLVVEKLATIHLVRRYPIVFGRWRERLLDEGDAFPSLCHSLLSITERSPNEDFKEAADRLLKRIARRLRSESHRAAAKLTDHLGGDEDWWDIPRSPEPTRHELLSAALARMLKRGSRSPPFKIAKLAAIQSEKDDALDDLTSLASGGGSTSMAFDAIDWANCVSEDFDNLDCEDDRPRALTLNVGDALDDDFVDEELLHPDNDHLEDDDFNPDEVETGERFSQNDIRTPVGDAGHFPDAFDTDLDLDFDMELDPEISLSDWSPSSSQSDSITTPPESQDDSFSAYTSQFTDDVEAFGAFDDAVDLNFDEPEGMTTCRPHGDALDSADESFEGVPGDDRPLDDTLEYSYARLSYSPELAQTTLGYPGQETLDDAPMLSLDELEYDSDDVDAQLRFPQHEVTKTRIDDLDVDMEVTDHWDIII